MMNEGSVQGMQPEVSVILCTYNRAAWLERVLRSLLVLRTESAFRYEIVVVDNASTDETPAVVESVAREATIPLRYFREFRPGPSAARNRGISEARGEWLAFLDDDELADRDWLWELLRMAREKQARVAGGAVHLIPSETEGGELSPALQQLLAPGGRRPDPCRFSRRYALNSGNQLVHRSVFEEIGRYEESWVAGGEDTELFTRMERRGIPAWYTPRAIVRHLVPPYRRSTAYLRWLSLRQGWSLARRDAERYGLAGLLTMAAARSTQAACVAAVGLLARARQNDDQTLLCRCPLWRTQGYLRQVLRTAAPRLFPQTSFLAELDFRGERQQFA